MKKILTILLLLGFSVVFGDNLEISKMTFKNVKVQKAYEKIIGKLSYFSDLSEDTKVKINSEILDLNQYFILLEKAAELKDRISGDVQVFKINNSVHKINEILKMNIKNKNLIIKNELNVSIIQLNHDTNSSIYGELMYYNNSFEGKKTANGNIFSQSYFSAAKCNTPLNTFIQTIFNSKSILVKVNDRPNCKRFPNLIDLSTISFDFLAKRYQGKKKSEFIEIAKVQKSYYKGYINEDFFSKANVIINSKTPNSYFIDETFNIGGQILNETRKLSLIIDYPSGKEVVLQKNDIDNHFLYSIPLDEAGEYKIRFINNLLSSENFSIFVFDKKIFDGKKLFNEKISIINEINIENEHIAVDYEAFRVRLGGNNLNQVILSQDDKRYEFYGIGDIVFFKEALRGFDLSRNIRIEILSSKTLTGFSHDYYTNFNKVFSGNFNMK